MSTNALIRVYDEEDKLLVTIYKHWDGYPEALGQDLDEIVSSYRLVNGLGMYDTAGVANGMGCFAATLIKKLKKEAGDVYIATGLVGSEEYLYSIYPNGEGIRVEVEEL